MKMLPWMLAICLVLGACATQQQTNATVTGGAIGAAAGALISDRPVEGAIVGGAMGAAAGALLSQPRQDQARGAHRDRGRHEGEYRRRKHDDRYRHEDNGKHRGHYRHDEGEDDD